VPWKRFALSVVRNTKVEQQQLFSWVYCTCKLWTHPSRSRLWQVKCPETYFLTSGVNKALPRNPRGASGHHGSLWDTPKRTEYRKLLWVFWTEFHSSDRIYYSASLLRKLQITSTLIIGNPIYWVARGPQPITYASVSNKGVHKFRKPSRPGD
jgi:hypothetical protein